MTADDLHKIKQHILLSRYTLPIVTTICVKWANTQYPTHTLTTHHVEQIHAEARAQEDSKRQNIKESASLLKQTFRSRRSISLELRTNYCGTFCSHRFYFIIYAVHPVLLDMAKSRIHIYCSPDTLCWTLVLLTKYSVLNTCTAHQIQCAEHV